MATAIHIDDGERQLVGQDLLRRAGPIRRSHRRHQHPGQPLYADAQAETAEAYVLWGLIVTTTLAIVLSSITAGGALARMTGHDVPQNNIEGMVYVILVLITTCVFVVVFGLRYF